MPAEPTPTDPAPHPVSAVPRRLRVITAIMAAGLVIVMSVVALLLKESTTGVVSFRTSDQVAMVGLGLAMGAGVLLLGRSRVDADASGVRIRNVVINHEVPWSAVRAVRFDQHSPWASLLLSNDDEVAMGAIQAADGQRALVAVRGLRALLADHRERNPAPREDLLYPRE
ncbi:PH domain-containing protein [Modestobacter sp. VKM Ac-2983]|uniref:PH domain-containing protein n=1 Tax=Modestobacter sp. VKM Ac-2983 TaxID=3004137 RepID=UPI0022AB9200|nr:PH domain-containing protein [Modestobacter sp. VKM Ac-2983]MCZ2807440.1 PH domain-containing protein [Modestobacter sp. VKM Ac-2983]